MKRGSCKQAQGLASQTDDGEPKLRRAIEAMYCEPDDGRLDRRLAEGNI